VKRCAGYPWLFLDRSKNASRRWCAMNGCGTQEKISSLILLAGPSAVRGNGHADPPATPRSPCVHHVRDVDTVHIAPNTLRSESCYTMRKKVLILGFNFRADRALAVKHLLHSGVDVQAATSPTAILRSALVLDAR
jgi:CGNR zinc finger